MPFSTFTMQHLRLICALCPEAFDLSWWQDFSKHEKPNDNLIADPLFNSELCIRPRFTQYTVQQVVRQFNRKIEPFLKQENNNKKDASSSAPTVTITTPATSLAMELELLPLPPVALKPHSPLPKRSRSDSLVGSPLTSSVLEFDEEKIAKKRKLIVEKKQEKLKDKLSDAASMMPPPNSSASPATAQTPKTPSSPKQPQAAISADKLPSASTIPSSVSPSASPATSPSSVVSSSSLDSAYLESMLTVDTLEKLKKAKLRQEELAELEFEMKRSKALLDMVQCADMINSLLVLESRSAWYLSQLIHTLQQRDKKKKSKENIEQELNMLLQNVPEWCVLLQLDSNGDQVRVLSILPQHYKQKVVLQIETKLKYKDIRAKLQEHVDKHKKDLQALLAKVQ